MFGTSPAWLKLASLRLGDHTAGGAIQDSTVIAAGASPTQGTIGPIAPGQALARRAGRWTLAKLAILPTAAARGRRIVKPAGRILAEALTPRRPGGADAAPERKTFSQTAHPPNPSPATAQTRAPGLARGRFRPTPTAPKVALPTSQAKGSGGITFFQWLLTALGFQRRE
jgi:hypothetical protein